MVMSRKAFQERGDYVKKKKKKLDENGQMVYEVALHEADS